ncbi:MAG TPA: fluoride efflux transporter CrcB [Chitinophagaceae bacterium]|nr:fluoride efflux transporter CrcB [Chitinophagaceae bacterium]
MKLILLVGLGSFIGGILRYLLSSSIQLKAAATFPYGTFAVNLIGCFLIGCLYGFSEKWNLNMETKLLLTTGLLGGFTTFSAFSFESYQLIKAGHLTMAITYLAGSVVLGLALTFAGAWLFKPAPVSM